MAKSKVSNSDINPREGLTRRNSDGPPKGSGSKRVGFLQSLFRKLGLAKKPKEDIPDIPPPKTSYSIFEVEEVTLPVSTVFDDPDEVFLKSDGTPLLRAMSVPTTNYQRTRHLWEDISTVQSFEWKSRKVTTLKDVRNAEIESRMQHLIMRCSMDGYEVTPQEAYDVLVLVQGAVDEAVEYMKVLRDFDR
ncbi:hypothetical protein F5Y11DRAFT_345319 [Daldinia sp. FL1419]|nr:hypothetical protein F5Y11DRAFT_345319 [Daldinia sp. FL1419]